ncbi:MAG: prephenate dehydrogenase/arogenate dehydrogenase family protein [Myxococcota bacterium]
MGAIQRLGIVGVGLIGGSLARAFRTTQPSCEIVAVDQDHGTRALAESSGVFDRVSDSCSALNGADVVVLGIPLRALTGVLEDIAPHVSSETIITDVIGVKSVVADRVKIQLGSCRFVGAHPMVGGPQGGFESSRPELFENSQVLVCPGEAGATETVETLWQETGAKTFRLSESEHDRAVALTSHVPYVVALCLAQQSVDDPHIERAAGPQWRDVTKRARFAPDVMAQVSDQNPYLNEALSRLAKNLLRLAGEVESPIDALARELRSSK